jgi:hypothetical protein
MKYYYSGVAGIQGNYGKNKFVNIDAHIVISIPFYDDFIVYLCHDNSTYLS